MPTGFGRRMRQQMVNWAAGKTPANTAAGVWWVALNTGDPGDDGQTVNEAIGAGYAAQPTVAADWDPATLATPNVLLNANPVQFGPAGADWSGGVNFLFFSLWTHVTLRTENEYVGRGALLVAAPVLTGQSPLFPAGNLRMRANQV